MTPKDALHLYFDPRGRLSRKGLALAVLAPLFALMLAVDASNSAFVSAFIWALILWPLMVATPWKRLHDTGRTGKWNAVFLLFYAIGFAFFLGEYVQAEGGWPALFDGQDPVATDDDLTASGLGGFSTVLIFLPIQLFWLYLIPGTQGENRYGPSPLKEA
ncbi:MAG: DUF805 domain-containing protein [Pseudomonadota bacterium]